MKKLKHALRFPNFEVYVDHIGDWRWRLVARNGRIVADSGEGYNSRAAARTAANKLWRTAQRGTQNGIEVLDQ